MDDHGMDAYKLEHDMIQAFLADGPKTSREFDAYFNDKYRQVECRKVRSFEPHTYVQPINAIGAAFYLWILQNTLLKDGDVIAYEGEGGGVCYRLADTDQEAHVNG